MMNFLKKSPLILLSLLSLTIYSCNQGSGTKAPVKSADTVFRLSCYRAIDGKDTAFLQLKDFKKRTEGTLLFKFFKKAKNDGDLKGTYKGDTLFVNYGYHVGNESAWHINPVALLKKDGKLIMGVGKIGYLLGIPYFDKKVPIDFNAGRFTFEPVECTNK